MGVPGTRELSEDIIIVLGSHIKGALHQKFKRRYLNVLLACFDSLLAEKYIAIDLNAFKYTHEQRNSPTFKWFKFFKTLNTFFFLMHR